MTYLWITIGTLVHLMLYSESMARKRMIDPEFWSDEKIGNLTTDARLLFIGMWNFADDEGIIKARPEFLKSNIFPYDSDMMSDDVKELFKQLVKQELIFAYSNSGQQYALILNFWKHQVINKPLASKLPKPPVDQLPPNYVLTTVVLHSKMKGNEMKGNEMNTIGYSSEFESFWKAYPRKVGKGNAWRAWQKLKPNKSLHEKILDSVIAHSSDAQWEKDDGQYIPHPATFLNQRRFDDEILKKKIISSDKF